MTPSPTPTFTPTPTNTPIPTATPTAVLGADTDGDGYGDFLEDALGENRNLYCRIMRADVDYDGHVSIIDITLVAIHFGEYIPPAPSRLDQDADQAISILDLTLMANVFTQPVFNCAQ